MITLSVFGSVIFYVVIFGISAIMCRANIQNRFLKFLIIVIPPLFLATFRYNIGYDYGSYISGYNNMKGVTWASFFQDFRLGNPIAFNLITKFAALFNSDRVYLFILALCVLVPGVAYILRNWDDREEQPMILFLFLFSPFIFSLSACKQGIALSILMFSLSYVYERKPIKFVLCVLIAFLFHSTAIIFIFIYFLWNQDDEVQTWKKISVVLVCVLAIINLQYILTHFLNGAYERYISYDTATGHNRTFYLYSLMAIFFILFRQRFNGVDKKNELLIIMLIVGAMFQYLGFSNAFIKRIGEYFMMSQVFLLPQIPCIFTEGSKKIVNFLLVIYIVAIFILTYPVTTGSNAGFIPFTFKFY